MSARARSRWILMLTASTLTTSCCRPSTRPLASPLPSRCEPVAVEVPAPAPIDCRVLVGPAPAAALATLRALPPCRGADGVRLPAGAPCRTADQVERGDVATAEVLRWGSDLWRCAALAAAGGAL